MKIPEWLKTTLSFIIVILIFIAYGVRAYHKYEIAHGTPTASIPTDSLAGPVKPEAFVHPLTVGGTSLTVAFASTPAIQEQGLSDTDSLAPGTGMLFIFPG